MEFSPTPVFYGFIGLMIGMVIGWDIGFFDSNSRTAQKIESAQANAEIKIQEAEKKVAQTQSDDPGLLRLKKITGVSCLKWMARLSAATCLWKKESD